MMYLPSSSGTNGGDTLLLDLIDRNDMNFVMFWDFKTFLNKRTMDKVLNKETSNQTIAKDIQRIATNLRLG